MRFYPVALWAVFLLVMLSCGAMAGDAPVVLRLWPGGPATTGPYDSTDQIHHYTDGRVGFNIANIKVPSMAGYLPASGGKDRAAVVICPGGGYAAEAAGHDAISSVSARPDFAILLYPVITMGPGTHIGSRNHLIGAHADAAMIARFSLEEHVTAQTPPLFIVQAEDDHTVPVVNSVMMAAAAAKAGVPCELHLLQKGGHGFGMGKEGAETSAWFDQMLAWMRGRELIASSTR